MKLHHTKRTDAELAGISAIPHITQSGKHVPILYGEVLLPAEEPLQRHHMQHTTAPMQNITSPGTLKTAQRTNC